MRGRSRHQGGSLLGFVAVAILLAGLLVGGLYFVQRYNDGDAGTGEIASNTDNSDTENTTDNTATTSDSKDETNKNTTNKESKDEQTATSSGTGNSDDKNTSSTNKSNENNRTEGSTDVSHLPATGPTETILQFAALGVVTFAFASFIQSRRSLDF